MSNHNKAQEETTTMANYTPSNDHPSYKITGRPACGKAVGPLSDMVACALPVGHEDDCDAGEDEAAEQVQCERCSVSGERGDHPGEGRIVAGGGETALGPWANCYLCDECAEVLMRPGIVGCTCAHHATDDTYSADCALPGHRQIALGVRDYPEDTSGDCAECGEGVTARVEGLCRACHDAARS